MPIYSRTPKIVHKGHANPQTRAFWIYQNGRARREVLAYFGEYLNSWKQCRSSMPGKHFKKDMKNKKFADRLRKLRIEKGATQKELAHTMNLSSNCVCEWEKLRSEPSIDMLLRLAAFFGVSTDYLLGYSDDFGNVTIQGDASRLVWLLKYYLNFIEE